MLLLLLLWHQSMCSGLLREASLMYAWILGGFRPAFMNKVVRPAVAILLWGMLPAQ